jgi:hypothetical protein
MRRRRSKERLHHLLKLGFFRRVRLSHGSILRIATVHEKAMQKARSAIAHAQQNLTDLKASNDFASIEAHWESFLDNANRAFTRLEQAANFTTKGHDWWGTQVHEWKKDELLRYIRQQKTVHTIRFKK